MTFNRTKFVLLKYGHIYDLKTASKYFTSQENFTIEEKETLRDMGGIMNHKPTFSDHIHKVC